MTYTLSQVPKFGTRDGRQVRHVRHVRQTPTAPLLPLYRRLLYLDQNPLHYITELY
jgi:hypothetical protein